MKTKFLLVLSLTLAVVSTQAQSVSTVATNFFEPNSIATDPGNNVYVADSANNRIVAFTPTFTSTNVVAGQAGLTGTNNGYGASARFAYPLGIVYARGGLVVSDQANQLIRYVTLAGQVSNLAGIYDPNGFGNDVDGPAVSAQFSYPAGLAADANGVIYIADEFNNAIRALDNNNVVSTVASGFNQPMALTVDDSGNLWVADKGSHTIKRITRTGAATNVTIVAGTSGLSGSSDNLIAASAQFNLPSGILWMSSGAGLLISDTGNNRIRRLYYNSNPGVLGYSVETTAGTGQAGLVDGLPSSSRFNAPAGLAVDSLNQAFYVADRANNALRRLQTTPPQPKIANPTIGIVEFPPPQDTSLLTPVTQSIFDHMPIMAIRAETGVQTYITYGPTPPPFQDNIPSPNATTGVTPAYLYAGDGLQPDATKPSIFANPPFPDFTIKAISLAPGRPPSDVVTARFQFKVATPSINGNNAASLPVTDPSTNSLIYYTIDGSDPTNTGVASSVGPFTSGQIISFLLTSNATFKTRAFLDGFFASDIASLALSPTNYAANKLTFGFANGEASSDFVGAAGQWFMAPITLSLLSGQTVYSMQFNVTVTNLGAAPSLGSGFQFRSMLMKPIPGTTPPIFTSIAPAMFTNQVIGGVFTNGGFQLLPFTNSSESLLGVGWLEVVGETNLYDASAQDLVKYSLAYNHLFKDLSQVIVGGYSIKIPTTAPLGAQYQIQLGRPSGSADALFNPVLFQTPTNGSLAGGGINSIKQVTVGSRQYLVGDVIPFRWFNAGDFGDTNLANNDVMAVFQAATYHLNVPDKRTDFFDAMDSSDGTDNGLYNGNDAAIDSIAYGDGSLNVDDVYVTFRRSLDPGLTWYARYWSNGVRQVVPIPNSTPSTSSLPKKSSGSSAPTKAVVSGPHSLSVQAGSYVVGGNQNIQIPVQAQVVGDLPVRVMMLGVTVTPLDGAPAITNAVTFTPSANLGAPTLTSSQSANNYAAAWLNSGVTGVSGTNVLGTLNVTLPPGLPSSAAYLVHFDHFSASPNGLALFPVTIQDGLITAVDRSSSSWGDGISDSWRLLWFGTTSNLLSAANMDPDGDGVSNWGEFVAGTNPQDASSKLQLMQPSASSTFTVQWPTVLNKQYVIESSPTLFSGTWSVIASNLLGNGQVEQFVDPNPGNTARFYRVRVQ